MKAKIILHDLNEPCQVGIVVRVNKLQKPNGEFIKLLTLRLDDGGGSYVDIEITDASLENIGKRIDEFRARSSPVKGVVNE